MVDEFPPFLPQDMLEHQAVILENATNDHIGEPHELQDSEDIISEAKQEGKKKMHFDRIHLVEKNWKLARENALGEDYADKDDEENDLDDGLVEDYEINQDEGNTGGQ